MPQPGSSSKKRKVAGESSHSEGPSITGAPISRAPSRSRHAAKEARRVRGEIACAECRRLKIKCDRQVPCSTCISRGCSVLCPNDVLPPGDNSRHLDHATDHLKKKISKLEERMRVLEDALAIAQAQESDRPHVLLAKSWKPDEEEETADVTQESDSSGLEDILDALGTLHIDEKGKGVEFFGPSGGTESVLLDDDGQSENTAPSAKAEITSADLRALRIPAEADLFFFAFPFTPIGVSKDPALMALTGALPSYDRALILCKTVLENLSWMFQIVTLRYLTMELVPSVYGSPTVKPDFSPHDLALLYIVFAIGALVDMEQLPYNAEALRYYIMARAAAGLQPIMEKGSLATVRFLHLLSIYNGLCGKESSLPNTYALVNIAGIMAQRIGLHVDPSRWNLDEKTSYERRAYFWNLMQADAWQSLGTGRPPSLANCCDGCRFPTEEEEAIFQQGEIPLGFGVWGHRQTKDCLIPLLRFVNATKPPSYRKVLELDRQMRSAALPVIEEPADTSSISASMRWWVRAHYIDLILIFLHRGFFARAIATHPDNPLQSPYAHSFITCYYCSCHFLRLTRVQFSRVPQLMTRIWQIWTFTASSALIIGAVAMQSKGIIDEPHPILMFQEACALFEDAGKINSRAAKVLPVLLKMREKVYQIHGIAPSSASSFEIKDPNATKDTERIAIFGGKTRLVASQARSTGPSTAQSDPARQAQARDIAQTSASTSSLPVPPWQNLQVHVPPYFDDQAPLAERPNYYDQGPLQTGQELWDVDGYHRPDFILDDTWTAFLQRHGAIPKQA